MSTVSWLLIAETTMIKIEERVQAFMDAEYEYKISDAAQEQFGK